MNITCGTCQATSTSQEAFRLHMLEAHESYPNYQTVEEKAIYGLNKASEIVKYILIKHPTCRSNDSLLQLYCLYFKGYLVYNSSTHTIHTRESGLTYDELMEYNFETVSRARRKLQETARAILKDITASTEQKEEAIKLLPSQKIATQRELLDSAYRQYFAKR